MNNTQKLIRFPNRIAIPTLLDLREVVGKGDIAISDIDYAMVLWGTKINDGFGGEYYWDNTSRQIDNLGNGNTVIKPKNIDSNNPGRWLLLNRRNNNGPRMMVVKDVELITGAEQSITHDWNTKDIIVQVDEQSATPVGPNITVEFEVKKYDNSIVINVLNISNANHSSYFNVLLMEIIN